ncbi:MAG: hypothetical protein M3380_02905, partial [Chloroflexota bacterium]|nr:hypothetical protein [Chloroflexota bacterium]
DCLVHEAGSLSVGLISLRRWGRARPIYFGPGTETLEIAVDGLTLQLPWDANRFVELVENLRRTGP